MIQDYSPNWDYTEGGSKILICLKSPGVQSPQMQQRLACMFGQINVAADFL